MNDRNSRFRGLFLAVLLSPALLLPTSLSATPLRVQINELHADPDHVERLKRIKELGHSVYKSELDRILASARQDLEKAEDEREFLKGHVLAIAELAEKFDQIEAFEAFGAIERNRFDLFQPECKIGRPGDPNFVKFNCGEEYEYAIEIWRRTELVNRILLEWKGTARAHSLQQIRDSEIRWQQFSEKVTSDQFPWETIINGWIFEGTVSTPPRKQFRILHPVAVLSYADESGKYDEEIGVEFFGLRTYGDKYDPEWGLSIFALLESDTAEETGWGLSLSHSNFSFAVVSQDTVEERDETKILLGYNLARLFENKKNELARKKQSLFDELEQFKADLDAIR